MSQDQPDALREGRRIYLGNLPYKASPYDIGDLLTGQGFDKIANIHLSVDPVSARNPGYCFVDFLDKESADRALSTFSATINGRPVKIGPCEPKKQRLIEREDKYAFKRWGDWNSQTRSGNNTGGQHDGQGIEQGPTGALTHFNNMVENHKGRRLYVGGLDKMVDQAEHNREVADLLAGFNPIAIGKRITPDEYTRSFPGKHHYCFVDFESKADMDAAIKTLNGRVHRGGRLKVVPARPIPKALKDRHLGLIESRFKHEGDNVSETNDMAGPKRALESSNWRRRDD
ncbi:RNA recognition motif domain-containing protein [Penicillium bovifimosum]|uniref:RNA recognition motif domain-containing protein n=1 Tax=Penicillium bovifimosum TaxID=126998 RepID=A0A9W9HAA6_9EURO|nr:RNA recognition motif domain-containing protein [Penicillium bovifimosum]KAJ5142944.1 RNA recognition motif domain-containing protein [Penicillium bovifimosum]